MTKLIVGGVLLGLTAYVIRRVFLMPWERSEGTTVSAEKHALLKDEVPRYRQTYDRDDAKLRIPPKVRARLRRVS